MPVVHPVEQRTGSSGSKCNSYFILLLLLLLLRKAQGRPLGPRGSTEAAVGRRVSAMLHAVLIQHTVPDLTHRRELAFRQALTWRGTGWQCRAQGDPQHAILGLAAGGR
jgi:hypothetical protein